MAPPESPVDRKGFRIAIICALPREFDAVTLLFDRFWDEEGDRYGRADGDGNTYITGCIGNHNVVLVVLPSMGLNSAAAATASLRMSYTNLEVAILVGICGGVPCIADSISFLGDVVVSKSIIQYDYGRRYPGHFAVKDTTEDSLGKANRAIRGLLAALETDLIRDWLKVEAAKHLRRLQSEATKRQRRAGYDYPGANKDILYASDYAHRHRISCDVCADDSEVVCDEASKASCTETGCEPTKIVARERSVHLVKGADFIPQVLIGRIGSGNTVMKSGKD